MNTNNNDIYYIDTDISMIEQEFEEYLTDKELDCFDFAIDGKGFALIGRDCSKVILYEKKVYYLEAGATYTVYLHALRVYHNYDEAMDNIDGDLSYYVYGLPVRLNDNNVGGEIYEVDR